MKSYIEILLFYFMAVKNIGLAIFSHKLVIGKE